MRKTTYQTSRSRYVTSLLLSAFYFAASACATTDADSNRRIVRRVGEVRRVGAMVSPFCYEWFIRAELLASRGQLKEAIEAYRSALTGPEEDVFVLSRLAEALDLFGQSDEANEALQRAEAIDIRSEAVWLTRARIFERHARFEEAISAYQRAEASAPFSAEPALGLAKLLSRQGARERAVAVLEGFDERSFKGSRLAVQAKLQLSLARKDASGAIDAIEQMLRIAPVDRNEICEAVRLVLESGELYLAYRVLEPLSAGGCDERLHLRILIEADRRAAAEQLLAKASPESFGGLVQAARAYLDIGRPELAKQLAEEQLAQKESGEALVVAGEAELRKGRFLEAALLFSKVSSGTSAYEKARLGLARALFAEGMGDLAAEVLSAAREPTDKIRSALAEQRLILKDPSGALAVYHLESKATWRTEEDRARLLERTGQTKLAASIYAKLGQDPTRVSSLNRARARAEWLVEKGDFSRAIKLLETQVENLPEDLSARARLAELRASAGDFGEARREALSLLRIAWEPALRIRAQALLTK
ncbi:MAG: tetratricopeptide repeat protein [Deltaproteobacteria bacterium]|nr:tetratricopeptide repeat protein [Deltaproteobacteria bacterium]